MKSVAKNIAAGETKNPTLATVQVLSMNHTAAFIQLQLKKAIMAKQRGINTRRLPGKSKK